MSGELFETADTRLSHVLLDFRPQRVERLHVLLVVFKGVVVHRNAALLAQVHEGDRQT